MNEFDRRRAECYDALKRINDSVPGPDEKWTEQQMQEMADRVVRTQERIKELVAQGMHPKDAVDLVNDEEDTDA